MGDGQRGRPRSLLAGAVAALVAACTVVGPDYAPPEIDLPAAYDAPVSPVFRGGAPAGPWWAHFDDAVLDEIVRRGLEANLDLRIAFHRVREARALARAVDTQAQPSLDFAGDATGDFSATDEDSDAEGSVFGTFLGFWDLDLFGGIARRRQAAWAEVARQEALHREARRLIAAEIARNYVELRAAERRLSLAELSLELQRRTLTLVEARVESGLSPGFDGVRAEAQVNLLRADLGPLRAQIDRSRNAIAVVLGLPPGALDEKLAVDEPEIPQAEAGPAVGVPAEMIRRRPDVQAAELALVAATADVGVATADLYPRLTLPGTVSVGTSGLGAETVVTGVLASLSAAVDLPLYDAGRRQALVTAAEERVIQAVADYRGTVLDALEEVESALVGYQGARERRDALVEAVENNRVAYEQSQELYRQGLVTFIDGLDTQRQWNASLQQLATAERDLSLEVVRLFTALGGDGYLAPGETPRPSADQD